MSNIKINAGDTVTCTFDNSLDPGDQSYTIDVVNTGTLPINSTVVTDPLLEGGGGSLNDPTESDSTNGVLNVGETWSYTGTYTVTQADLDGDAHCVDGSIDNTATFDDGEEGLPPIKSDASVQCDQDPEIELIKTGALQDNDGFPQPGDTITYAFKVTNIGNVSLTNVTLDDVIAEVVINGGPVASLAPGASDDSTFWGTYQITQEDIDNGVVTNLATVCGDPGPVCDEDPEDLPLEIRVVPKSVPVSNMLTLFILMLMMLAVGAVGSRIQRR